MPKSKFPKPISGKRMTGVLTQPLHRADPLVLGLYAHGRPESVSKQIYAVHSKYVTHQLYERVLALAKHYGVEINAGTGTTDLLIALAADFIVGFNDGHAVGKTTRGRQWLDVRNVEADAAVQFLKPAPDDYFVFEPTVIARNAPSPKPKAQLSLL